VQEFYGHGKNIINVIMKVKIIIIMDSMVIDKVGACNMKSQNVYVMIKLKIDMYQSKSMQGEIRVVPRSSGLYGGRSGGRSGQDYPGTRTTNGGKPRVIRK